MNVLYGYINERLLASDDYDWFSNGQAPSNELSAVIIPTWTWTFIAATEDFFVTNKDKMVRRQTTYPWIQSITGRQESGVKPAGQVMFKLRHSNSSCLRSWCGISCWEIPNSVSSMLVADLSWGHIGLWWYLKKQKIMGGSCLPMSGSVCNVRVGGTEKRLSEARWNCSIFNP